MNIDLKALGMDEKQILELVVNRVAEQLLENHEDTPDKLQRSIREKYIEVITNQVNQIADSSITPRVGELLAEVKFGATNEWGEKVGPELTMKEFLAKRVTAWMTEKVNQNGKTQQQDNYNWSAHQSRLAHLIHEHLHQHIQGAVQTALKDFHIQLAAGLEETVKLKLKEALGTLSVKAFIQK
jgi:hypothetical protein